MKKLLAVLGVLFLTSTSVHGEEFNADEFIETFVANWEANVESGVFDFELQTLDFVNAVRAYEGLPELEISVEYMASAMIIAYEYLLEPLYDFGLDASRFVTSEEFEVLDVPGLGFYIFYTGGQTSPEQLVQDWLDCPNCNWKLLSPTAVRMGIGSVEGGEFGVIRIMIFETSNEDVSEAYAFEREVFELTNIERRNHGLSPLIWDNQLAAAARAHTLDMARGGFLSHSGSDGSNLGDRVTRHGFDWSRIGENVAAGQRSPQQVIQSWMNSPGHRQNILSPNFTHFGAGFLDNYWTQVFGTGW